MEKKWANKPRRQKKIVLASPKARLQRRSSNWVTKREEMWNGREFLRWLPKWGEDQELDQGAQKKRRRLENENKISFLNQNMKLFICKKNRKNKNILDCLLFFIAMGKTKAKPRNCPPRVPQSFIKDAKAALNFVPGANKGDNGAAWKGVMRTAGNNWKSWKEGKTPSQIKARWSKTCWTKTGKLKKKPGVRKSKGKGKAKAKSGGRKKLPVSHVGLGWVAKNCSQAAADRAMKAGKKSVGIQWIRDNCSAEKAKKAHSYIKSKKKSRVGGYYGGCGCAACKAGIGGCSCSSGYGPCSMKRSLL